MKKLLLSVCACLCMATAAFAQNAAKNVSGTYTGDLYISLGLPVDTAVDEPIPDQTIYLSPSVADSLNTIDFSLPNFNFMGAPLGDINLSNVGVVEGAGEYNFAPNDQQSLTFLAGTESQIDALVSINDSTSSIKNSEAYIDIDVVWVLPNGGGTTPIYVTFVGKKTVDAGINTIPTEVKNTGIYTLNGVRVNTTSLKSLPKGIYIINGKKQIVK